MDAVLQIDSNWEQLLALLQLHAAGQHFRIPLKSLEPEQLVTTKDDE